MHIENLYEKIDKFMKEMKGQDIQFDIAKIKISKHLNKVFTVMNKKFSKYYFYINEAILQKAMKIHFFKKDSTARSVNLKVKNRIFRQSLS